MKRITFFVALALVGSVSLLRSETEPDEVREIGREVSGKVMARLQKELGRAIAAGGPVGAIDVCSQRALELTQEVSEEYEGVSVKRTSLKYRNPKNAPDELETRMLERMSKAFADGKDVGEEVEKSVLSDQVFYRYYKPILTGDVCLNCHGEKQRFSEPLLNALEEKYPNDRATGYQAGDFRGVIRVQVAASEVARK